MKANRVRELGRFPDHLPTLGNPSKQYVITIPDQNTQSSFYATNYTCSRTLLSAPIYFKNVTCVINHQKIIDNIKSPLGRISKIVGDFFMINDKIFYMNYSDRPILRWERWVPMYSSFCTAFFIFALRTSTQFIFDKCPIPVYPLAGITGSVLSLGELDIVRNAVPSKRDISVFFQGRISVRPARHPVGKRIMRKFPGCHIGFTDRGDFLSSEEYINIMSRTKLAWCPRSIWSHPEHNCNCPPAKEFEAMCMGAAVLKHPIGIVETEKREPGIHFIEVKNDSSDVEEKIQYYLEHDDEREKIAQNGRLYFDRNCSVLSRMRYIVQKSIEAMGEDK